MKKAAVIGSGTMGNGIAQVFAQNGWSVALIDVSDSALEMAIKTIKGNLERMIKKGTLTAEAAGEVPGRITPTSSLDSARDAMIVVEAASENMDLKFSLFQRLDEVCGPETILATNTSSISITEIAAHTRRPEKVIGMHFMNPVPVMQLVEVIRGQATDPFTTRTVMETATALGKTPVEVNDYPGFVSNRVLMPMINEAIIFITVSIESRSATPSMRQYTASLIMGMRIRLETKPG